MDGLLEIITGIIANQGITVPIFAFLAGVLTSLTPCSLSCVPLVIGFVGGVKDTKKAFWLSLTFALGTAITFTTLGAVASIAGSLIGTQNKLWYLFLGTIMVLMSLQIMEIYQIIPSSFLISKNKKTGYIGAFFAGILSGIFSSPCSTPVLIALLAIVARDGYLVYGILLLLFYSLGHGILTVVAGTSVGFVQKISASEKYEKFNLFYKITMGVIILLIGFYMFYLGF